MYMLILVCYAHSVLLSLDQNGYTGTRLIAMPPPLLNRVHCSQGEALNLLLPQVLAYC